MKKRTKVYRTKQRIKFLDAAQIEQTINEVVWLARSQQIALVGGAAMQVYGSDRLTADVDFIASEPVRLVKAETLSFGGVRGHAPNGTPVDIIVRNDGYTELYAAALRNAQPVEGLSSYVVRPEYLAAMKLVAGRIKDEGDLEHLILSDELNLELTRKILLKYLGPFAVESFDAVVYEMEWRKSRERK